MKAMRAAVQAIRDLARAGGERLSAATLDAVSETLQALPSDNQPGQLTHPLKPLGFEVLVALGVQGQGSRVPSPGSRGPGPGAVAKEKAAAKKEAAERAARRRTLQRALRAAQARQLEAETALAASRKALAKVERDHAAARDRMQFLDKRRDDAEQDARQCARDLHDAANARTQAEQDLNTRLKGGHETRRS